MHTIVLDGESLTIGALVEVARDNARVEVEQRCRDEIIRVRDYIDRHWLKEDAPPAYGFNTGVGKLKDYAISQADNDLFQFNLVKSHCGGVGEAAGEDVVRAMMLSRVNAFCQGVSGLRIEVVDRLVEMLNRGVHPVVPVQGSVGASGDLAPLAHMVSVMIGFERAEAWFEGERLPAPEALSKAGIVPVRFDLKAKDCLALINGTNFSAGMAALNLHDGARLLKVADTAGALSLEAIRGELAAFDPRIHAARRQLGQIDAAENIRRLTKDSRRTTEDARAVHLEHDLLHPTYAPRVQDQYSFRCLPQVHGACRDNLAYAKTIIERELNAATDNPLVFRDQHGDLEFISGGNFHCEPVAFAMDILSMSLAEIGNISERRSFALCDTALNYGLPPNLAGQPVGLNYGYGIICCSAAAIASENKTLCFPAVADTIPTKSGQEDHVSMATWACRKARQIVDNVPKILGIEYLLAARAVYITEGQLGGFPLGEGTAIAYRMIGEAVRFQSGDDYMADQSGPAIALAKGGRIADAIEEQVGPLH